MKNNIFKTAVVFSFTIPFIFLSCSKEPDEIFPSDPVPINLTADQVSLIESENSFAFDIFKKVIENSGGSENIIISPLSISYALSMTLNGANGATRDAMLEALRVNGITPEIINNSYKNLSEELLNVDKRVLISIANSVWTENNFVVKTPFTDILTGFYNAESKSFDIADQLAPEQINNWIESKTNGLIKNMVDKLNDNTVMLLINAIYFKGKWKSQFDVKNTVQRSFYKPGELTVEVQMMKQTADFKIFTGDKFVLAEFPYGQGNFVMDVILPDDYNEVNGIIPLLNDNNFKGWINQMGERKTDLTFPRFKYGYKKQLKDVLTNMGMGIAFTGNADFSNISDIDLLINDVTHQAFIETNEEGTEAAAATIVDVGLTSMPLNPFALNVDHSFLYIIRETTTNSILFMGRVVDPLAN
ncbi:MAG: serpin family protein [Bacteroidia bacterium]|nr:serpin family protein [Bacteroidia bacterium]